MDQIGIAESINIQGSEKDDGIADLAVAAGYAAMLNMKEDTDVYFCIQGNTGCACLTVEENKTQSYQRRVFLTDKEGIRGMREDIMVMYREKEKQSAPEILQ